MTPTTFFLDPEHEKSSPGSPDFRRRYCERRKIKSFSEHLPGLTPLILSVVLPLGMALLVLLNRDALVRRHPPLPDAPPPDTTAPLVFGTVLPAASLVMLLVTVLAVLEMRRRYRLAWEGKVVMGKIESCTGTEYLTVPDDNPLHSRPYTRVYVEYSAEAPSGRRVRGRAMRDRYDLRREQLPPAGTPVCVLMLDERKYDLL